MSFSLIVRTAPEIRLTANGLRIACTWPDADNLQCIQYVFNINLRSHDESLKDADNLQARHKEIKTILTVIGVQETPARAGMLPRTSGSTPRASAMCRTKDELDESTSSQHRSSPIPSQVSAGILCAVAAERSTKPTVSLRVDPKKVFDRMISENRYV